MVTKLIETAIEIEGLLRNVKDGEPSEELYTLLIGKTLWLAEECDKLAAERVSAAEASVNAAETPEEVRTESDEEEEAEEASTEAYQQEENETSSTAESTEEESQGEEIHENEPEEEAEEESDEEAEAEEATTEAYEETENSPTSENDEDDILLSIDEEDEENEEPVSIPEKPKPEQTPKNKPNLKSFFSLNDRFLYARELFDGDMKMFDATLRQLEGIEYFSDIEDYFFNELEWDPERRFVSQYMDTLRPHFK